MTTGNHQLEFSVRAYGPGEAHEPHYDRSPRISLLLAGAYSEETDKGSITAAPGDVLMKGDHIRHENRFGGDGALLASIGIDDDEASAIHLSGAWHLHSDAETLSNAVAMLDAALGGSQADLSAAVYALLSHLQPEAAKRSAPPRWIEHLKADLEEAGFEAVDVAARAKAAGTHPAYASALFRRCYGASITSHARYHAVRRATALLGGEMSLKDVALSAGFYDQSHMNRSFKRVTGRTPGQWRRLSSNAAARAS